MDHPEESEFTGENYGLDSSFFRYARTKVAIEFKPDIFEVCTFGKEPYRRLPGERQVYDFIALSNFLRILVGLSELESQAICEISKICAPYGIPTMSFDSIDRLEKNVKVFCKSTNK